MNDIDLIIFAETELRKGRVVAEIRLRYLKMKPKSPMNFLINHDEGTITLLIPDIFRGDKTEKRARAHIAPICERIIQAGLRLKPALKVINGGKTNKKKVKA